MCRSLLVILAMTLATTLSYAQTTKPTTQPKGKAATQPTTQPAGGKTAKKEEEDPNDPKAVAVIDRYLEAIGGKENLKSIEDRTMRFVNRKFSPTGVTEMKMARFMKGHYMIREEWELPGMGLTKPGEPLRFLQVYDGEKAWVKAMGYVSALTGRTLTVFVWDKFLDDSFMHWKDDGYIVKHRGEETLDEVPVHRIQVKNFAGTQRINYFFEKESGLLLKKEWRAVGQTGNVNKECYYDQYQKVRLKNDPEKWIKVALNQKIFEDGELNLETEYTEVRLNTGLDDNLFSRPDGPDFEEFQREKNKKKTDSQPTSKPSTQPKKSTTTKPTTRG